MTNRFLPIGDPKDGRGFLLPLLTRAEIERRIAETQKTGEWWTEGNMRDRLARGEYKEAEEERKAAAVEAARPKPPKVDMFAASALHGKPIPSQQWLVRDLIPAGQPSLLSGDGGLGKSLLALQLAYSVVTGNTWLHRVTAIGPAMYLSCEDETAEIHRRLAKIAGPDGLMRLANLHLAPMAEIDALLAVPAGKALEMTPLYGVIAQRVDAIRPALLVLDSLADVFGGSEIDRAQVRWFIGQLRGLCHRTGCTIIILAHPSLSGMTSGSGLSGSTHWNNAVRSRLYLTRPEGESFDQNERLLEVKKNNRGEIGKRIELRWENGVFVDCDGGVDQQTAAVDVEAIFLRMLARYAEQGRFVNASSGTAYAPLAFSREPDVRGMRITKRQLQDAMARLFEADRITVKSRKVDGRDRSYLAEK